MFSVFIGFGNIFCSSWPPVNIADASSASCQPALPVVSFSHNKGKGEKSAPSGGHPCRECDVHGEVSFSFLDSPRVSSSLSLPPPAPFSLVPRTSGRAAQHLALPHKVQMFAGQFLLRTPCEVSPVLSSGRSGMRFLSTEPL